MVDRIGWKLLNRTYLKAWPSTKNPRVPLIPTEIHNEVWEVHTLIRSKKCTTIHQIIKAAKMETSPLNKFFKWDNYNRGPTELITSNVHFLIYYVQIILGLQRW